MWIRWIRIRFRIRILWIRIRIRNTGLQPMELVEEVQEGGVEALGMHIRDGGHLELDVEVEFAGKAGIGEAVAEYAEVEDLLAAAEEPVPEVAAVRAQVPDAKVPWKQGRHLDDIYVLGLIVNKNIE